MKDKEVQFINIIISQHDVVYLCLCVYVVPKFCYVCCYHFFLNCQE
jgi:hypothetical protein